jgi:predicted AlkP superfamily phosphohydrolase/phosphomutase
VAARTKLLVIGVDAANGSLVRTWASQEGILPNFARLMRQGRTATLRGIDGFFTGSTWPSLLTSTNPAHHGIHYLAQLVPGTYRFARPHEGEYIRAPMFWECLTHEDKRLAILDVPLSKLDRTIRGMQMVEWAGHDAIFGFQTTPAGLAADILAKHGRHPVPSDCDSIGRTSEDFREFVATLIRGVEAKARLTIDLLGREPWDLFLQVFTETHCVGHQCWHLHDPSHPDYDPAFFAGQGDPLRRVYQAVDKALGELLAAAGNPPVLVVLSHGMSHCLGVHALLPEILGRLGLSAALPPAPQRRQAMDLARPITRWLPRRAKTLAQRWLERPARPGSFGLPVLSVDPKASRCFVVPNGLAVSGIRLNLAGREPCGTLAPGKMADELFQDLRRDLLEIRDERTQAPRVRRVMRTSDLYQGPNLDCLPDILVEWHDSAPVGSAALGFGPRSVVRVGSPRIGTVQAVYSYGRTGEHRADGLLIAAGPGVEPGGDDLAISILDVAPTITAALGVHLPTAQGQPVARMIPTANRQAAGQ